MYIASHINYDNAGVCGFSRETVTTDIESRELKSAKNVEEGINSNTPGQARQMMLNASLVFLEIF